MGIKPCSGCGFLSTIESNFCGKCGNKLAFSDGDNHKKYLNRVISFYVIFIVYIAFHYLVSPDVPSLITDIFLETIFILIIVVFTIIDYKNILRLFKFKNVPVKGYLIAFGIPFLSAPIVYIVMEAVNLFFFDASDNIYAYYVSYDSSLFWSILFIAVVPAIFEELGFRGFLFNQMLKVTSPKITILVTGFLFALMHMSILSFIWLIPFGMFLGYMRYKYRVIWLGMITHFLHNLIVLFIDYYFYIN